VHFLSPASREAPLEAVQTLVGSARLVMHAAGPAYYANAFLPRGRVARLIRRIGPSVIRAYDPSLRGAVAVCWAKRLNVPAVISVHADLDEQRRVERRLVHQPRRAIENYTLPRADAVIGVTDYVARYAERHGARRVSVIYNRVYTDQFAVDARAREDRRGPLTILSVGRLVPQKYQECLIRAMVGLDARLVLIGDGPLRDALDALARSLGVRDRVTFRPAVPHSAIASYYREADVFAIATHHEGFCIPVLEAMAAGLPVVASRIAPIEEVIASAGLLVENEPHAFRSALRRLLEDPQLRAELAGRAVQRARRLDGAEMEAHEAALYRDLCRLRPAAVNE